MELWLFAGSFCCLCFLLALQVSFSRAADLAISLPALCCMLQFSLLFHLFICSSFCSLLQLCLQHPRLSLAHRMLTCISALISHPLWRYFGRKRGLRILFWF